MENLTILNEREVLYAACAGVTRRKVIDLMNLAGFTITEMGQYVHVTPRNLQPKNSNEKLRSDISERVLFIQNLY